MNIKTWGWILAVLALANMLRISVVGAAFTLSNWLASIIVLLIAIVLLSNPTKNVKSKTKTRSKKAKKRKK